MYSQNRIPAALAHGDEDLLGAYSQGTRDRGMRPKKGKILSGWWVLPLGVLGLAGWVGLIYALTRAF